MNPYCAFAAASCCFSFCSLRNTTKYAGIRKKQAKNHATGLAMFAGVAEMIARAMVGFWFVPLWGYFAACIASPVAWFFACFFLIPAYFVVFRKLQKEKQQEAAAKAQ